MWLSFSDDLWQILHVGWCSGNCVCVHIRIHIRIRMRMRMLSCHFQYVTYLLVLSGRYISVSWSLLSKTDKTNINISLLIHFSSYTCKFVLLIPSGISNWDWCLVSIYGCSDCSSCFHCFDQKFLLKWCTHWSYT